MSLRLGFGVTLLLSPFAIAMFVACADSTPPPGFQAVGGESASDGGAGGDGWVQPSGGSTANNNGPSTNTTGPSTSSTTTNTSTATSSSTGNGGLNCNDPGPEPNDSEATAVDLGTITDCDDQADTVTGILEGVADRDWFKYQGSDTSFCSVDPDRVLTSSDPVRVCKYFQCPDDDQSFDCPSGTTAATSPDGRPGCCGNSGFNVGLTCGSFLGSDDALVYLKLETTTNDCVTYSLTYHY